MGRRGEGEYCPLCSVPTHSPGDATFDEAVAKLLFPGYILVAELDVWCPNAVSRQVDPWKSRKLAFVPRQSIVGPYLRVHTLFR